MTNIDVNFLQQIRLTYDKISTKLYNIIMHRTFDSWIENSTHYGISNETASIHTGVNCGSTCSQVSEGARGAECVECSKEIAASHVVALEKYRDNIIEAANSKCFSADLLAGFISRVTNGGLDIEGTDGWIPCHNDPTTQCFGIMNICGTSVFYEHLIRPLITKIIRFGSKKYL